MLPIYEIRKTDLTVKRNNYELKFPEHMHEYLEIIYVYSGAQHLRIEGQEFEISEGSLAAVFPDTLHSFFAPEKQDKKETEVLILMCAPKLFGGLFPDLKSFRPENPVIDRENIPRELTSALEHIRPGESFEIMFSWTCVIMSHILEILTLGEHSPAPVSDITYKIIKYIEENFTEPITRRSLARHFNVSECYISKIFSRNFKMNLRNYLGLIRAEYAAGLVRATNESFTVISQQSGFDSTRTFNRMFKAAYGQTPGEYRSNINQLLKL
ncbi:MAG: helix-turn-helix transcriptional regulator [Oscillospiraceae bacterium]|nr:helix-turn-helix transcriptional regulator [Oscillospiraceae bacterium]